MNDNFLKDQPRLPWFGIPKLLPFLKPYRKKIVIMVFLGILSSMIDALFPMFNKYILNVLIPAKDLSTLPVVIILYVAVLLFQVWDNYYTVYTCARVELLTDRDLRNRAFKHVQTLSFSYFNQNNVGYIHSRVMSDTGKIGELVAWRLMDTIWNGFYIIFMIVFMFMTNVKMAIGVMILVPPCILIIMFFQKRLLKQNRKIRELNSRITGDFNEGITGVRSIKTLVAEDRMLGSFKEDTFKMRRAGVKNAHNSALFISLIAFISSLMLAMILYVGGNLTIEAIIGIGTLSVFMSYAMEIPEQLQNLMSTFSAVLAVQVNIERFTALLETESEVYDTPDIIEKYGDTFEHRSENWEKIEGDVEFENVSFQYPDGDELVLSHFNLKIPKGSMVAIVGETGAGKSTLVNLVCRFFEPTGGRILIDGKDVRERSVSWLHDNIGYVLQTPHLFSGTVRENLLYGNPDATEEEMYSALRMLSAEDMVRNMDSGLDSDVGEGGSRLSAGERQLISFARAIIKDPALLILDEATSSIDTVTEKKIQEAISSVIEGRTSFVIAHRLSTIVDADVILAVRDGKIIERGSHKELMEKGGYYYRLYMQQFADTDW
ncbi:MAG: ABC transporter ATP-binding protein/permease [Lachnospiraceae bacterium]|nr:ABC transporter ATP-binding protein/permease [Lachnospiraceae bacterium]